jgi:hypothetical protein
MVAGAYLGMIVVLGIVLQVECQTYTVTPLVTNVQNSFYLSSTSNPRYKYFSYTAVGGSTLQISTFRTATSGDPDLYVSTTNQNPVKSSASTYQYSNSDSGTSTVSISVPTGGQTYYIGVYAYTTGYFGVTVCFNLVLLPCLTSFFHMFIVKAGAGAAYTTLSSYGSSTTGAVASSVGYKYYKFTVPSSFSSGSSIKITLTAISGDPDMYVSRTVPYPTSSSYTYSGTTTGSDTVTIPYYSWYSGNTFYIGVKSASSSSTASYTIKYAEVSSSGSTFPSFHFMLYNVIPLSPSPHIFLNPCCLSTS